tara:strand:+ start:1611 stop:2384 length:774 start_codon:yes stop_codon:yes gene_type:complete
MATLSSKARPLGVATSAQGALADTSVQPGDSPTFAAVNAGALVSGRAVVGGTANAITLTTGLNLPALVSGMQIRFRTGGGNTGATTINVDGLGAVTAVTVTSAALPDGYIRSNIDTVITYNSPNWIVSREIERGSNANGTYIRFEDGTAQALLFRKAVGTGAASIVYLWTLPIQFKNTFGGDARASFHLSVFVDSVVGGWAFETSTNAIALGIIEESRQITTGDYTATNFTATHAINSAVSTGRYVTQRLFAQGVWY